MNNFKDKKSCEEKCLGEEICSNFPLPFLFVFFFFFFIDILLARFVLHSLKHPLIQRSKFLS